MDIKLLPVTLEKTDTCLTYAFKRVGLSHDVVIYEDLENLFEVKEYQAQLLKKGRLLIWDKNRIEEVLPNHIDENGRILFLSTIRGIHVAVYEGDLLVSDCTRCEKFNSLPVLMMRYIRDIGRMPDKIVCTDKRV